MPDRLVRADRGRPGVHGRHARPGAPVRRDQGRGALTGRLAGRVAFVTGGSRGIGAAVVRAFVAEGGHVGLIARRGAQDVAAEVGGLGFAGDVTDESAVTTAVDATAEKYGGLDILVANAGRLWLAPTADTSLEQWQKTVATNLTGVFLATKAALPHLVARGGGALVALSTVGVDMTELGANPYWVAKAGVERYYAGLAHELRGHDIAVNCLRPTGVVRTEGWQAGGGGREVGPEMVEDVSVVAEAAVRLAVQRADGITGRVVTSTEVNG